MYCSARCRMRASRARNRALGFRGKVRVAERDIPGTAAYYRKELADVDSAIAARTAAAEERMSRDDEDIVRVRNDAAIALVKSILLLEEQSK